MSPTEQENTTPPDAPAVMRRLLILKHLLVTGMATPPPDALSQIMRTWQPDERRQLIDGLQRMRAATERSLRDNGLWPDMTPAEQAFIRSSPSEVSLQMLIDVSWLMEAAECLLWALGYLDDLPPYDTQASPDHLKLLPPGPHQTLLNGAALRPADEISSRRDAAESWHWRSRTRQLQESGHTAPLPSGLTRAEVIRMSAEGAASDGLFKAPLGDDFPAFGQPYRDISPEQWSQAASIVMERHRALNWLCGYAPDNQWDETPTDT